LLSADNGQFRGGLGSRPSKFMTGFKDFYTKATAQILTRTLFAQPKWKEGVEDLIPT